MKNYVKNLTLSPSELVAGDSYQLELRTELCVGDDSLFMLFDLPAYLGSSRPSLLDQEDNGYFETVCSNPLLEIHDEVWDMEIDDYPTAERSSFKGMAQRIIAVSVSGERSAGDSLTLKLGYTRDGMGVGFKAPTVVLCDNFSCPIELLVYDSAEHALPYYGRTIKGMPREEPLQTLSVSYSLKPREAVAFRLLSSEHHTIIKGVDRFGNVAPIDEEILAGVTPITKLPGQYAYEVEKPTGDLKTVLPINRLPRHKSIGGGFNVYFGDLHTHSAYSNDAVEREKMPSEPLDLLRYARDVSCLDFAAITDHHQPWDSERNKIGEQNWNNTVDAVKQASAEGFVCFCGFENRDERGDTAVIFGGCPPYSAISSPELTRIDKVWDTLSGFDLISIPHFHNPGSMPDGEWISEKEHFCETVLEIYSCHGSYECEKPRERAPSKIKARRSDRNGRYFLEKGYKYGFTANSDNHKGNIGCCGLTAVLAERLDGKSVFEAIRSRRTYLTSGARITLFFEADGVVMGGEIYENKHTHIRIMTEGEQNIKYIETIVNGKRDRLLRGNRPFFETEFELMLEAGSYIYVRAVQDDDHFAISSPIFIKRREP